MPTNLDKSEVARWAAAFREWSGGDAPVPESPQIWRELADTFELLLVRHHEAGERWLNSYLRRKRSWVSLAEASDQPWATDSSMPHRFLHYLWSRVPDDFEHPSNNAGASEYLEPQEVGRRVVELRNERGVSQRRLADAIGVDPSAMSRIESGQRGLSVNELVEIAKFFGVPTEALLRRALEPAPLFRNEGGEGQASEALGAFEAIIDDFFAFEAAARV